VPEGRQVFGPMNVEDNLRLGGYLRPKAEVARGLEHAYELFPVLRDKRTEAAGMLSGGQQQMLAIGRALMSAPKLLLLDEPSMGLAPKLVAEVFATIERLRSEGVSVLLVEQNAAAALAIADHGYVLETGRIVLQGTGGELRDNAQVREAYLGM
jgi:branched-chain amino acid transport system ATP-binding protein